MSGSYTSAIAWYRKTLELEPHFAIAYNNIGDAYLAMGDYTNALDNFEQNKIFDGANEAETKRSYDGLRGALKAGGVRGYWQENGSERRINPTRTSIGKLSSKFTLETRTRP